MNGDLPFGPATRFRGGRGRSQRERSVPLGASTLIAQAAYAGGILRSKNAGSRRYHKVRITPDLFGVRCAVCTFRPERFPRETIAWEDGRSCRPVGLRIERGTLLDTLCTDLADAERLISVIETRRPHRGYEFMAQRR